MGAELIMAMILAGAVTTAAREGKNKAHEKWETHRAKQREKAEAREQRAKARAEASKARRDRARAWVTRNARNPLHPVGWGYGLGWLAAATGGAAVAGARAAPGGARSGARIGASAGRTAARAGWGAAATWAEFKRQREADETQRRRAEQEGPRRAWLTCPRCSHRVAQLTQTEVGPRCRPCAAEVDDPEADPGSGGDTNREPPPGASCQGCGDDDPDELVNTTGGVWCFACISARSAQRDDPFPGRADSSDDGHDPHSGRTTSHVRPRRPYGYAICDACGEHAEFHIGPGEEEAARREADAWARRHQANCPASPSRASGEDPETGDGGGQSPVPRMVTCLGCGAAITWHAADAGDGRCGQCRTQQPREGDATADEAAGDGPEIHDAEVVDDDTDTSEESDDMTAIAEGDNLESTLAGFQSCSEAGADLIKVVDNFASGLTAKDIDDETIEFLNAMQEAAQNFATLADGGLEHVQSTHQPVGDVFEAVGEDNVADKEFYHS